MAKRRGPRRSRSDLVNLAVAFKPRKAINQHLVAVATIDSAVADATPSKARRRALKDTAKFKYR